MTKKKAAEASEADKELFLTALGGMGAAPVKAEDVETKKAGRTAPGGMKLLRDGKISPQAEIDLHGLTTDEALYRVRHFLDNSAHHGYSPVLIITGRGNNSAEGPVLRGAVEKMLGRDLRHAIREWGRAPARLGGEGAIVVFIK